MLDSLNLSPEKNCSGKSSREKSREENGDESAEEDAGRLYQALGAAIKKSLTWLDVKNVEGKGERAEEEGLKRKMLCRRDFTD